MDGCGSGCQVLDIWPRLGSVLCAEPTPFGPLEPWPGGGNSPGVEVLQQVQSGDCLGMEVIQPGGVGFLKQWACVGQGEGPEPGRS